MPRLFVPSAGPEGGGDPPGGRLVLTPGAVPTVDYYLLARASMTVVDTRITAPQPGCLPDASDVIVVRHASRAWLRLLARERPRLRHIVYLLDDDLPAALRAMELPRGYALRTGLRFMAIRGLLERACDRVWASTPELARRYPQARARVLEPLYLESGRNRGASEAPSYFYHGTWAHRREIAWLVPIVREVQRRLPEARFDICGGDAVRRMYRGIPGVNVRAPLPWPRYRALADEFGYRVGLAPCLDTPFNRARSHVKLLDITRFGAAGVYSRTTPYALAVRDGETGLLCDNEPGQWVEAILRSLQDPAQCGRIHAGALDWCRARVRAAGGFP